MNRILFFSSLQVFFGATLVIVFKTLGYTMATLFAQPSQYFPLVLPITIIFGIFSIVLAIFHKPKSKVDNIFKIIALMVISFATVYNAFSPWIYIICGANLQILLLSIEIFLYALLFTFFVIEKYKRNKKNEIKESKKI